MLCLFKPEMLELQRPAILAHGAHGALIEPLGSLRCDLQLNLDLAAELAGEPLDNLLDDHAHLLVHALGIELHRATVKRRLLLRRFRDSSDDIFLLSRTGFALLVLTGRPGRLLDLGCPFDMVRVNSATYSSSTRR